MNKKILLIDNDTFYLKVFKYKLSKSGFKVFTTDDGIQAMKIIQEIKPNLIFLELILPGKDGFEILKEFGRKYKFVILSVLSGKKDINEAKSLGAQDIISKEGMPTNTILDKANQYTQFS